MRPRSFYDEIAEILPCESVTPSDITACIAVRLTDINPWVIERLRWLGNYEPAPRFLILDFGSYESHSREIWKACEEIGAEYRYIDDCGEFSLALTRNASFGHIQTDFIFFTDIDFVYERSFYGRLAEICNRFEIRRYPGRAFGMPAYHVAPIESRLYESLSFRERDRLITEWSLAGHQTEFGTLFEFIAPYSNNLLCHRNLFSMIGGYCADFRGYGSEDFEFFVRFAIIASRLPMPNHLIKDIYGPRSESFFGLKNYTGFRRLLELLTYPSESIGLKSFHIWHPMPSKRGYWTAKRDRKRKKLKSVVSKYIEAGCENLIKLDFLPRTQNALCIFEVPEQWEFFLPLRIAGYKLWIAGKRELSDLNNKIYEQIEQRVFDRIFICDSANYDNSVYHSVVEFANRLGIQVTTIKQQLLSTATQSLDTFCLSSNKHESCILYSFIAGEQNALYFKKTYSIEFLILDGKVIPCGSGLSRYPFSWRSYVAGHLTFKQKSSQNKKYKWSALLRKLQKLIRTPKRFLLDVVYNRLL